MLGLYKLMPGRGSLVESPALLAGTNTDVISSLARDRVRRVSRVRVRLWEFRTKLSR